MNILTQLKTHLVASGITRTIKLNNLADEPLDQIMLRDTGEIEPGASDTASMFIEHRTFQIIVRGNSYDSTINVCHLIRQALHQQINLTVDDRQFISILATSGFQPITNEVGNYEFSGNFKTRVLDTGVTG